MICDKHEPELKIFVSEKREREIKMAAEYFTGVINGESELAEMPLGTKLCKVAGLSAGFPCPSCLIRKAKKCHNMATWVKEVDLTHQRNRFGTCSM